MRKLLLAWSARLSLLLIFCTVAMASFGAAVTVTYRGVKYKSDKKHTYLMVVSAPYSGDIVVASSVYIESIDKTLPVTEVGSSAFSECEELISVTLPESVTKIGDYAFDSSEKLKTVSMGDNVTSIGHWSFRNCHSLENFQFPKNLATIGNYCFDKNDKMTEITLPATLTNIGGYAFEGNPQLTTVYSLATTPPAVKKGYLDGDEIYTIFDDNDYTGRVLYVPAGCVGDYKLTFGWHQFPEIREMDATGIKTGVVADAQVKVVANGKGAISVTAPVPTVVNGYDLAGRLVFSKGVPAGNSTIDGLNAGLLVVNGKKVVVE